MTDEIWKFYAPNHDQIMKLYWKHVQERWGHNEKIKYAISHSDEYFNKFVQRLMDSGEFIPEPAVVRI
jgi:hypothetical protein